MKAFQIQVGGHYTAKVSGKFVTVRVDAIRNVENLRNRTYRNIFQTHYDVTNLTTGRKTTFRSAVKFRSAVNPTATG